MYYGMSAFNNSYRSDKLDFYYQEYFKVLPGIFESYGNEYGKVFFDNLVPRGDNLEVY
jgi:hypothetical protein